MVVGAPSDVPSGALLLFCGLPAAGKSTMDDIHYQASGASARRPPSRPTRAAALLATRARRPDPRRARARPAGPIARAEERGVARSLSRARARPWAPHRGGRV